MGNLPCEQEHTSSSIWPAVFHAEPYNNNGDDWQLESQFQIILGYMSRLFSSI